MGAHHHVQLPGGQGLLHGLPLLGGLEPGKAAHGHREGGEPLRHGGEVLLGQYGGGAQQGRLLPVLDRLEGRPDGHLGLAVAHVPAEEPIHGPAALHVRLHLPDAPELVRGLLIGEGGFQLPLPGGVGGIGEALDGGPFGVQGRQVHRQLLGRGPGLLDLLLPLAAPQLAQRRGHVLARGTHVFLYPIQLVRGDIELVAALVEEQQVVPGAVLHGQLLHAHEPAHAVGLVDHVVPYGQVGKFQPALLLPGPGQALAEELRPREHQELLGWAQKAPGQALPQDQHLAGLQISV